MRVITCEQVSEGHPDKICDQVADAIVTDCLAHDKNARVAIECLLKDNHLVIAGELTSTHRPDYQGLAEAVFDRIGRRKMGFENALCCGMDIRVLVKEQSADIAQGVNRGGAGDQGMMYGYATNETPELLPIPFVVATKFLQILKALPSRMLRADAKAQVSFDYDAGKITTFLCSVQHSPDVEPEDFRHLIKGMMVLSASEYGLNTDFEVLVNPTGRFVIGGSFADCGVTGRKLACDTYGGLAESAAMPCPERIRARLIGAAPTWQGRSQEISCWQAMRISVRYRSPMRSVWRSRYLSLSIVSAPSLLIRR